MLINKDFLTKALLFLVFCLTFNGFYSILLILINLGMSGYTRSITIPLRGLISLSLFLLVALNFRKIRLNNDLYPFLLFSAIYLIRIVYDNLSFEPYYLPTLDLLYYFLSFAILPFLSIVVFRFESRHLKVVINSLLLTGLAFSSLTLLSYNEFIGVVGRLSSRTVGEEVISPLILSYCGTLTIGISVCYLLYNKLSFVIKLLAIVAIVASFAPFFLGASRGSIIALFLPFLVMILSGKSVKFIFSSLIYFVLFLVGLFYLDGLFGSGLSQRFLGISDAVEQRSSSTSRIEIWRTSLGQFVDYPFFGDKLRVNNFPDYPHNLIVEVLQTTGFFGFIPFLVLVVKAWVKSIGIFKSYKCYSWVPVIFLQAFFQGMFSGALYSSAWFWTSMALVFAVFHSLNSGKLHTNVS